MTHAGLREDELVTALRGIVEGTRETRIVVGIGDDAAVWQPSRSHRSVVTSDALVEGVHFTRQTMSAYDVGWRSTVANVSDLAAMGARPVLVTIALGIGAQWNVTELLDLYRGIADAAKTYGLAVAGGDLTRAPALIVAMTAIGEVRPSHVTLRSGGRSGDVIASTGDFGASRAGLDVARGAIALDPAMSEAATCAHRRPRARVAQGQWLAASAHVHAMIDCSDGLSTDLARLCESSGVGAVVEHVPVAPAACAAAAAIGEPAQAYALAGGEEYELIVAIDARAFAYLADRYRARFRDELRAIGTLRREPGLVAGDGKTPLGRTGWELRLGAG